MKSFCIQDNYPEQYCHCYGCGRNNQHGLGIRSYWDGQQARAVFIPAACHIALPGYVYGGLLASLVDCHGIATASAAAAEARNRPLQLERYVTASLQVDYLRPTPMDLELEMTGEAKSMVRRRVVVEVKIIAAGKLRVRGEVVAAPMPASMS